MSLIQAVDTLRVIAEAIDLSSEDVLIDELVPQMSLQSDCLKNEVDKRIEVIELLNLMETKYRNDVHHFQSKIKRVQAYKEKLRDRTKELVDAHPELVFEGTAKKLLVRGVGGKQSIAYNIILQDMKHIVDPADLEKFSQVEKPFLEKTTVYRLKKEAFETYLRAGDAQSEIASLLPRGRYLAVV